MKNLNPNPDDALKYLELLGQGEDTFTFQTFDDSANKNRSISNVFHGTLEQHLTNLIRLNQNGAGIFVMVNEGDGRVHEGKKTCRSNDNVIRVRSLFSDADGTPLSQVLERSPPPHIVVESSPGKWHTYWLTHDTPLDEFKPRQQAIAKLLGTDPSICDLARVMRLPGFFHQKGEPFLTRLIRN